MESYVVVSNELLADADGARAAIEDAILHPDREPTAEQVAYWAARDALYSLDRSDLTPDESAAAKALYADEDLEVGHEGIGGFCEGQAEATIRTLRKAGFRVTRD